MAAIFGLASVYVGEINAVFVSTGDLRDPWIKGRSFEEALLGSGGLADCECLGRLKQMNVKSVTISEAYRDDFVAQRSPVVIS